MAAFEYDEKRRGWVWRERYDDGAEVMVSSRPVTDEDVGLELTALQKDGQRFQWLERKLREASIERGRETFRYASNQPLQDLREIIDRLAAEERMYGPR